MNLSVCFSKQRTLSHVWPTIHPHLYYLLMSNRKADKLEYTCKHMVFTWSAKVTSLPFSSCNHWHIDSLYGVLSSYFFTSCLVHSHPFSSSLVWKTRVQFVLYPFIHLRQEITVKINLPSAMDTRFHTKFSAKLNNLELLLLTLTLMMIFTIMNNRLKLCHKKPLTAKLTLLFFFLFK